MTIGKLSNESAEAEDHTMSPFGKRLIGAARQARKIVRGEADPKNYIVHIPDDIDVQAIFETNTEYAGETAKSAIIQRMENSSQMSKGADFMTGTQTVVADRETAIALIEKAIETLDQRPLDHFVEGMLTEGHRAGLSSMAISGDEPGTYIQFLVVCEHRGLISNAEMHSFCLRFVDARTARAA
jgi:hypothetical protein